MRRILMFMVLALLLLGMTTAEYNDSVLTNPEYNWDLQENETYGLPWYSVAPWEIELCAQGLTSSYAYDPEMNDVTEVHMTSPIYRDTITILAKKRTDTTNNITYYEIGWYFQPYENELEAAIIVENSVGQEGTIGNDTTTSASSFSDYKVFAYPCNAEINECFPFRGSPRRVKIQWRTILGGTPGNWNSLYTNFVPVDGGDDE